MNNDRDHVPSGHMPDEYDHLLGQLDGLPGSLQTKPATIQLVDLLGSAKTYIVRTVRQQDRLTTDDPDKDAAAPAVFTTFLEYYSRTERVRLVLPARVGDLIARQRDALTDQARRTSAKRAAGTRKARGFISTPPKRHKKGK